jgi:GT2 family glycosyltransferase
MTFDVTVIIPILNGEEFLNEELDALIKQDFTGTWEIVVADNGCTDRSMDIVREYQDRLPIRIVDARSVRGVSHARNVGIRASDSTYVAICDADDIVDPGWLSGLVAAAAPDAIVGGARDDWLLNPREWVVARGGGRNTESTLGTARVMPSAWGGNFLISRSLFDELGGFDETILLGEDADICYRAQLKGYRLIFTPDAVLYSRYRNTFKAVYRQTYRWSTWEPEIYRRYLGRGAHRRPWSEVGGAWARLILLWPYYFRRGEKKIWYVRHVAQTLGYLRGSIRYRALYL